MGNLHSVETGVYVGVPIAWLLISIAIARHKGWFNKVGDSHPGVLPFLLLLLIPLAIGLGLFGALHHKPRVDRTNELIKLINDNTNKFVALVDNADAYSIVPLKVAEDAVAELALNPTQLADLIQAVKDDKRTDATYIKLLKALNDKFALGSVIPTSIAGDAPSPPESGYVRGMQW